MRTLISDGDEGVILPSSVSHCGSSETRSDSVRGWRPQHTATTVHVDIDWGTYLEQFLRNTVRRSPYRVDRDSVLVLRLQPFAAMFLSTTSRVCWSSRVGLNSMTSVPA